MGRLNRAATYFSGQPLASCLQKRASTPRSLVNGLAHLRARKECDVDRLRSLLTKTAGDDTGAAGYILAWLLGVPASVLFLIFLMRGCT